MKTEQNWILLESVDFFQVREASSFFWKVIALFFYCLGNSCQISGSEILMRMFNLCFPLVTGLNRQKCYHFLHLGFRILITPEVRASFFHQVLKQPPITSELLFSRKIIEIVPCVGNLFVHKSQKYKIKFNIWIISQSFFSKTIDFNFSMEVLPDKFLSEGRLSDWNSFLFAESTDFQW